MHTRNLSEVVDSLIGILKEPEHRTSIGLTNKYPEGSPNEFGIFFGDEMGGFTHLPVLVVEGTTATSDITQVGFKTRNEFGVSLTVCHADLAQASSDVRRECLKRVETVRNILHKDLTAGGTVIYGYVTSIEQGYIPTNDSLIFSHRLLWYGMNKLLLQERN